MPVRRLARAALLAVDFGVAGAGGRPVGGAAGGEGGEERAAGAEGVRAGVQEMVVRGLNGGGTVLERGAGFGPASVEGRVGEGGGEGEEGEHAEG